MSATVACSPSTCISLLSHALFLEATGETYNRNPPLALYLKKSPFTSMCCLLCCEQPFPPGSPQGLPLYFTQTPSKIATAAPLVPVSPFFLPNFSWMQPRKLIIKILLLPSIKNNLDSNPFATVML